MKQVIILLIVSLILPGCITNQPSNTTETTVLATTEEMCIKITENSWEEVCNEIVIDSDECWELYKESRYSYQPETQKCTIQIPTEGKQ